jgi:hypothetical protein
MFMETLTMTYGTTINSTDEIWKSRRRMRKMMHPHFPNQLLPTDTEMKKKKIRINIAQTFTTPRYTQALSRSQSESSFAKSRVNDKATPWIGVMRDGSVYMTEQERKFEEE